VSAKPQRLGLSDHWRAKQLEPAPDGSYRPSKSEFVKYVCVSPTRTFGVQTATPVAWAPNGQLYAFVSGSHSIYLNCILPPNSPEGVSKVQRILHAHTGRVTSLVFHPRDPILISAGEDCIAVWECTTGKLLQKIVHKQGRRTHDGGVECMSWACHNQILITGSRDTTFILWRVITNPTFTLEFVEQVTGHKGPVLAVVYHQETQRVATAGRDSTIKLWDCSGLEALLKDNAISLVISDNKEDTDVKSPEASAAAAAGNALAEAAASEDAEKERSKKIKANVNKIALITNLEGHRGDVLQLHFMHKGRLLISGARDNTMKLWDLACNCHLRDISAANGHRGDIVTIVPLPDERNLFTASGDGTVRLWELGKDDLADVDDRKLETDVLSMLKNEVAMLIEGDDDSAAKAYQTDSTNGSANLFNKHVDKVLASQAIHEVVHAVALNPFTRLMVSSAAKNELRLWDISNLAEPRLIQQFVGHEGEVTGLALSADGKVIVSSSTDWSCLKYSMESLTLLNAIRYTGSILAMAATPNCGTVYLAGADYTPRGYDTTMRANQAEALRFTGHAGRVRACALSPDNFIFATGCQDFNLRIFDLRASPASSAVRSSKRGPAPDSEMSAFLSSAPTPREGAPIGLELASSPAVGNALPPLATYEAAETFQPGSGHIFALAFAPQEVCPENGKYLLAVGGADHAVRVYFLRGASASLAWADEKQHTSVITSLAWGRGVSAGLLFSASWDRSICVWRANASQKKPELVRVLGGSASGASPGHQNKISQLAITSDGAYLISASYDQTAIVWELTSGQFQPVAKYATVTNDGAFTAVTVGAKDVFIGTETGMLYEFPLFSPETLPQFMDVPKMIAEQEQQLQLQLQQASTTSADLPQLTVAPGPAPIQVAVAPAPSGAK